VPVRLTDAQHRALRVLLDDLVPADGPTPGAGEAGGAEYVDRLLGALDVDPPRVWAAGPFSSGPDWLELGPWERRVWRDRLAGWERTYATGLDALGVDYSDLDERSRAERRAGAPPALLELAFTHAVESLYGDPAYGGNQYGSGWTAIELEVRPEGWTDEEVSRP